MKIYLDACVIIYLIEGTAEKRASILKQIRDHIVDDSEFTTSVLSKLECLVKPRKDDNKELISIYEDFFSSQILLTDSINHAVIKTALDYRVQYNLKTPDAIHLATAKEEFVDLFITGDKDLARCKELDIFVVE